MRPEVFGEGYSFERKLVGPGEFKHFREVRAFMKGVVLRDELVDLGAQS